MEPLSLAVRADPALAGRRCARLAAGCFHRLHATLCEFAWLQTCEEVHGSNQEEASGAPLVRTPQVRTLVKLLVDAESTSSAVVPQGADAVASVSDLVLEELGISSGALVQASALAASSVPRWETLTLFPLGEDPDLLRLPSADEVHYELSYRHRTPWHAWRSDCLCRWALLPSRSHLTLGSASHTPLPCEARCATSAEGTGWRPKSNLAEGWGVVTATTRIRYGVAPPFEALESGTPESDNPESGTPESGTPEGDSPESGNPERGEINLAARATSIGDGAGADGAGAAGDAWSSTAGEPHVVMLELLVRRLLLNDKRALGTLSTSVPGGCLSEKGGVQGGVLSPDIFAEFKVGSLLLSGPPGSGKTWIVEALCHRLHMPLLRVTAHDLVMRFGGAVEEGFKQWLRAAHRCKPCIVMLDDAEALAATTSESVPIDWSILCNTIAFARAVTHAESMLLVVSSSMPTMVNPFLRDVCEMAIGIPMPGAATRARILRAAAAQFGLEPPDLTLAREIGGSAHGMVAADLSAIADRARLAALCKPAKVVFGSAAPAGEPPPLPVSPDEWRKHAASVRPSGLLGLSVGADAIKPTRWRDIGGLSDTKRRLQQLVEWPLRAPRLHAQLGLGGPRGILLYGPPGTGKTMLMRALASESRLNLLVMSIAQLIRPEVGASERALAALFERARGHRPCLLFLDELQSVFGRRGSGGGGRVSKQLLTQLVVEFDATHAQAEAEGEGSAGALVLAGATNAPEALDDALLRPGRLEHLIYVPPPRRAARRAILERQLQKMPLGGTHRGREETTGAGEMNASKLALELAARTSGFTGADLISLCMKAGLSALGRSHSISVQNDEPMKPPELRREDFEKALNDVEPSTTSQMLEKLEAWTLRRGG